MILDIVAATGSFLSTRWFERLTDDQKQCLEDVFAERDKKRANAEESPDLPPWHIRYMAYSLFSNFLVLVIGTGCMMAGLLTFAWTQSKPAAAVVTACFLVSAPFLLGMFLIGRDDERRRLVIKRLAWIHGVW